MIAQAPTVTDSTFVQGGTSIVHPHNTAATYVGDICALSYTNARNRTVQVQIDASCFELYNYAETLLTTRLIKVNVSGAVADNGDTVLKQLVVNQPTGNDPGSSRSLLRSVAAGGTLTVKVQRESAVAPASVPTIAEVNGVASLRLTALLL